MSKGKQIKRLRNRDYERERWFERDWEKTIERNGRLRNKEIDRQLRSNEVVTEKWQ